MTITNNDCNAPRKPLGLYLHIPFCVQKCNYCDFLSFGKASVKTHREYFRSLINEIKLNGRIYSNKYYVNTVFIGGGTPSLVGTDLTEEMMTAVADSFLIGENAEISIETNPKTLTEHKLKAYLNAGINRLSIGAQSFDNEILGYLGRAHNWEDFLTNYDLARSSGFRNINIDLMFSIPGQTMEIWMSTLKQTIELSPEHISFYGLQLEEGTPFYSMFLEGRLKENDDVLDRNMYHAAVKVLTDSGYLHYEISNAAKKGHACRHNLKYWSMGDYLGLGLGAHSCLEGVRFCNTSDLSRYIQIAVPINGFGGTGETESPYIESHHKNTQEDTISEYLLTGMRKREGIDLTDFERRFQLPIEEIYSANWHRLQKYIDEGYLIRSGGHFRLTEKGIDISNAILTEFV